jgi:glycosyltransferase involved in cell wall biosynthesis
MRILHFDAGKEMRGGQWQVLRLIEGLASAGIESTLLAREGAPLFSEARKGGWRVEPLGLLPAIKYARRHDLMHAHDARTHTMGAIVRGAPLVVARRVAFPIGTSGGGSRPARIGSKWKYARARHYIAVSEFAKKVLIAGGIPAEKISVVYDGVPILDSGGTIPGQSHIVAVQKGATLATEAANLAGVPVTLVTHLERDLRAASMLIYITHAEGLGSGVLLAMSAGIPVIASNLGGLPEIVRDRQTGLLVENDAKAIAAAIRDLLEHPDFARSLAAEARRAVLEQFTVEHMVRRTIEVYRQVLA